MSTIPSRFLLVVEGVSEDVVVVDADEVVEDVVVVVVVVDLGRNPANLTT